jgi:transposase
MLIFSYNLYAYFSSLRAISKGKLEVGSTAWEGVEKYSNNVKGVGKLLKRLSVEKPELVVLESTGGYERY